MHATYFVISMRNYFTCIHESTLEVYYTHGAYWEIIFSSPFFLMFSGEYYFEQGGLQLRLEQPVHLL
jgi:hypothetical protein